MKQINLSIGRVSRSMMEGGAAPTSAVLTGFIDNLDGDPPSVSFDSAQAGMATWDFHSSATPPTAGSGDIATGTFFVTMGANQAEIDLLAYAGETGFVHFRLSGSNILTSQEITVPVDDVIAPVLSSPTDAANGSMAAMASVNTDEGNGTLYHVITESATAPSAAQVKLGQDHTGSAAAHSGSQSVSSAGIQPISPAPSGLAASTGFWAHFMHEDAATNQSTVSSGDGFTTDAGAVPRITFPAVSSWDFYTQCSGSGDTLTADASGGITNPYVQMTAPNLGATSNFELRFKVEKAGAETVRYAYARAQSYTNTAIALFDLNTGTLSSGTGTMTDLGGGVFQCVLPFDGTTDAVGNINLGMSDLGGQLRLAGPVAGDEQLTFTEIEVWAV